MPAAASADRKALNWSWQSAFVGKSSSARASGSAWSVSMIGAT